MKFFSTRNTRVSVPVREAIMSGIAPDGGLYVPEHIPPLPPEMTSSPVRASIDQIGANVLSSYIDDIPRETLRSIVQEGLSFEMPIRTCGDIDILELFHGPTGAFKDVAAQILPRIMRYYLDRDARDISVLTATSGDTGGAVVAGFGGMKHLHVIVLFPRGKVSAMQRAQLTRVPKNVCSLEVNGSFDDCQRIVKTLMQDGAFVEAYGITTANSINIGRLLPQIIYYVYLAKQYDEPIDVLIPSGNMGNATAALFAQASGARIRKVVLACNENDPVVKYANTGKYSPQAPISTLSSAMDIGNPSNIERIFWLMNHDHARFSQTCEAYRVSDAETIEAIKTVWQTHRIVLDPHTAIAWHVGLLRKAQSPEDRTRHVIVATAHPAKFANEIRKTTDIHVPENPSLIPDIPENVQNVEPETAAVQDAVRRYFSV